VTKTVLYRLILLETNKVANNKSKKSAKSTSASASSDSNVVRIKASASAAPKKRAEKEVTTKVAADAPAKKAKVKKVKKIRGGRALKATGGYFAGAWTELRQVRWPNHRATWGLTFAVLAYSAFFVVLVLLLDALFKYLFELILGK
jgi:preprotein translocase SecE subunit